MQTAEMGGFTPEINYGVLFEKWKVAAPDKDYTRPESLLAVNELAGEIFRQDEAFEPIRSCLGNSQEAREKVLNAALAYQFKFPPKTPVEIEGFTSLLWATSQKEEVGRHLITYLAEQKKVSFGLKPYELDILLTSCKVGKVYDDLCLKWRYGVAYNPENEGAKERGLDNAYSIIKDGQQIPYSLAFPQEMEVITSIWSVLSGRLFHRKSRVARQFAEYFGAYAEAMTNRDLGKANELWDRVDIAWLSVEPKNIFATASRERERDDPEGIRFMPDFRLDVLTHEHDPSIEMIRESLGREIDKDFGYAALWQAHKSLFYSARFYTGSPAVFTGSLDFPLWGETLPESIRLKDNYGRKCYLNPMRIKERWKRALTLAAKVFPEDLSLFDDIDVNLAGIALTLAVHELIESVMRSDGMEKEHPRLSSSLAQDRSTICTTSFIPNMVEQRKLPQKVLLDHALYLLGVSMRYILLEYPSKEPSGSLVMAILNIKRMVESGFIREEGGLWRIKPEGLIALYRQIASDFRTQVSIQEKVDTAAAEKYLARAAVTDDIRGLLEKIKS